MIDASIVLITLNAEEATFLSCLHSIRVASDGNYELIVVDNGSTDDTVEIIKKVLCPTKLFAQKTNRGVATAFNIGAYHASSKNLIYVTQDVMPYPQCFSVLIKTLETNSSIGAVGCKLLYPDKKTIQHAGAYIEYPRAIGNHVGWKELDCGQFDVPTVVQYVTGAIFAIGRETWSSLQGFDEHFYPAYYEDSDFGLRLHKNGFVNFYQPQAVAVHFENSVTKKRPYTRNYYLNINRLRFVFKHYDPEMIITDFVQSEIEAFCKIRDKYYRIALSRAYRWNFDDEININRRKSLAITETLERLRAISTRK